MLTLIIDMPLSLVFAVPKSVLCVWRVGAVWVDHTTRYLQEVCFISLFVHSPLRIPR